MDKFLYVALSIRISAAPVWRFSFQTRLRFILLEMRFRSAGTGKRKIFSSCVWYLFVSVLVFSNGPNVVGIRIAAAFSVSSIRPRCNQSPSCWYSAPGAHLQSRTRPEFRRIDNGHNVIGCRVSPAYRSVSVYIRYYISTWYIAGVVANGDCLRKRVSG